MAKVGTRSRLMPLNRAQEVVAYLYNSEIPQEMLRNRYGEIDPAGQHVAADEWRRFCANLREEMSWS